MISATEARLRSEATKEELFNSELNNIQNEIEIRLPQSHWL